MYSTIKTVPLILLNRSFHTTAAINGIGSTMRKIMNPSKKKKSFYEERPILPQTTTFGKDFFKVNNKGSMRRVAVLNKLFMRHITDLMATGQMASEYAGHGLQINRVEVTSDYKGVNVYWISKGNSSDTSIQDLLTQTSKQLRHELSQLRVVGMVPRIYFHKDVQYAVVLEVDNRLAKADFGDDHVLLEPLMRLKTEFQLNMNLEKDVKAKIYKLEEDLPPVEEQEIPKMPQNVLGLNHVDIMYRLKKTMEKSQAKHRKESDTENISEFSSLSVNTDPIEFKTARAQRDAFKQFLTERQILRKKIRRSRKVDLRDFEYSEQDYPLTKEIVDLYSEHDDDYIDEDLVADEKKMKL